MAFEPLCHPGAVHSIRAPAIEICRVFEWKCRHYEQHDASGNQTCLYLFPLGMARSALDADPDWHSWIDSLLDSNPNTASYGRNRGSVAGFSSYVTRHALYPDTLRVPGKMYQAGDSC